MVAQSCQDEPLDDQHRDLDLRLVARPAHPGRQHSGAVMTSHLLVGSVDVEFVATRRRHPGAQVVADQPLRCAAGKGERVASTWRPAQRSDVACPAVCAIYAVSRAGCAETASAGFRLPNPRQAAESAPRGIPPNPDAPAKCPSFLQAPIDDPAKMIVHNRQTPSRQGVQRIRTRPDPECLSTNMLCRMNLL